MSDFSAVMFLGILIIGMNCINILLMIVKDMKIWAKFDRVVLFLGNERNVINIEMGKMRDSLIDVKNELNKIKLSIKEISCNK